jgi:hypothetical protein
VRAIAHWLIFAVLGPPLGVVTLVIGISIATGSPDSDDAGHYLVAGLLWSHLFGFAPALAAALAIRLLQRLMFPHEWLWAGLIGGATGLGVFVIALRVLFDPPISWIVSGELPLFFMVCAIPSWTCWYLSKMIPQKAQRQII